MVSGITTGIRAGRREKRRNLTVMAVVMVIGPGGKVAMAMVSSQVPRIGRKVERENHHQLIQQGTQLWQTS